MGVTDLYKLKVEAFIANNRFDVYAEARDLQAAEVQLEDRLLEKLRGDRNTRRFRIGKEQEELALIDTAIAELEAQKGDE